MKPIIAALFLLVISSECLAAGNSEYNDYELKLSYCLGIYAAKMNEINNRIAEEREWANDSSYISRENMESLNYNTNMHERTRLYIASNGLDIDSKRMKASVGMAKADMESLNKYIESCKSRCTSGECIFSPEKECVVNWVCTEKCINSFGVTKRINSCNRTDFLPY